MPIVRGSFYYCLFSPPDIFKIFLMNTYIIIYRNSKKEIETLKFKENDGNKLNDFLNWHIEHDEQVLQILKFDEGNKLQK